MDDGLTTSERAPAPDDARAAHEPVIPRPPRPAGLPGRLTDERPTVSFELYPPRSEKAAGTLRTTIARLAEARPDFFSVTYGASGSSRESSRGVVEHVLDTSDLPAVAHLTCLGSPPDEVRAVAEQLVALGVRDFLALRGDPPAGDPGWTPDPHGLQRASQLVELLRDVSAELPAGDRLSVSVAASPTALQVGGASCGDLLALRAKQDAGADFAITQVFFEVEDYVRYVEAARAAGVVLPLLPGVVPLTDPRRLRRLEEVSGVAVPTHVLAALEAEEDPEARTAVGRALGAALAAGVLAAGAPGLHLYTFNQHQASLDLLDDVGLRARAEPLA
ncbi:methylenetetrahydrofolate reductase [Actinotalea solisilvae]|uniref:methylenetetrahydrofolate reductase n=1 Tax=Actinotalea solisilvae TaxID=2072922 RepID=UPI0018F166CE|nr:methylenetetrahydrofolate reductase [Actinotalea solisilvae]